MGMDTHFTAKQIAAVCEVTDRSIRERAKKHGWEYKLKTSQGGETKCYVFDDLPNEIKIKLVKYHEIGIPGEAAADSIKNNEKLQLSLIEKGKQDSLVFLQSASDRDQSRARAIKLIIDELQLFQKTKELTKTQAKSQFVQIYNDGNAPLPADIYEIIAKISIATLKRWEKTLKEKGLSGLVNNYGNRKGTGLIDSHSELEAFALSMLERYPHVKGKQLHDAMSATFGGRLQIPAPSTCRAWLSKWKDENASLYLSFIDPDGWKNSNMVAFGRMDECVTQINQLWEFDSTPADVMLTDGRFSIVGVIDVFTRRAKCILKPTSNADAIALLIRKTILDWGKCKTGRTDNGADYTSLRVKGVFDALTIEHEITDPYSGWQKPYIERFFRTFSHSIAELCQGYIGHNVAERQRINARLTFSQRLLERKEKGESKIALNVELSSEQFQQIIDNWIENTYHHTLHSNLECTPFEQFTKHRHSIERLDNERTLDILLAPVAGKNGQRVVTKGDGIKVDGASYIAPELGMHVGQSVFCRYNPDDAGKIYVFHLLTKEFICEAVDPEIANNGLSRQEIAVKAKQLQREELKAQRANFKKSASKYTVKNIALTMLDDNASKHGNLTHFPKPSSQFESDEINAINQAIKVDSTPTTPEYTEKQLTIFEARRAELEAAEAQLTQPAVPIFRNDFHKAQWITEQSLERELSPVEKVWLHKYRNTNTNRQHVRLLDILIEERESNEKKNIND